MMENLNEKKKEIHVKNKNGDDKENMIMIMQKNEKIKEKKWQKKYKYTNDKDNTKTAALLFSIKSLRILAQLFYITEITQYSNNALQEYFKHKSSSL